MSFRKRSEVINPGGTIPNRIPSIPGRAPPPGVPNGAMRGIPGRTLNAKPKEEVDLKSNPGIRSSIITSQPTISTGTSDLDKLLGHQGLPLGNSLLLEESGTTDFSSILARVFASQGIMHNRIDKSSNCHVIVIGLNSSWSKDLPGVYKGSSKDKKKAAIKEKESAISVSNLSQSSSTRDQDLRIAWRYGLNKKNEDEDSSEEVNENYTHQFDITERLRPVPDNQEITFVQVSEYKKMLAQINDIVKLHLSKNPSKTIRILVPNLLSPSIYPSTFSKSSIVIPFIHGMRSILKSNSSNISLVYSIPTDLYPKTSNLISIIEQLSDSVLQLHPFHQKLSELIEKSYKNEPSKVQHGFLNIVKLPILSERGMMTIHNNEYAFKNGRKRFEIEPWGIPVEVDDEKPKDDHDHSHQSSKNIEF
ncbi:elongator complex protein 4 [[Candida] jaroonii]|uniref:Elongator complex protein 4 n=1 Tax=[Candida] jaroonii TaxID=467808 RepID=A0ACA9YDU9_9ASCO|nr:elongator complex protein 4 [[Candida] jaroonii]